MPDKLFRGLFDTALTDTITLGNFLLCVGVSLLLGLLLCGMTVWRSRFSRSLIVTLAILPAVVCVVILMVNGNVGTGVAVAGAFNLVRFRSAPGSAREIGAGLRHPERFLVAHSWNPPHLVPLVEIVRCDATTQETVDREVALVGSTNMDYRTFQLHYECGVLLYHMPAVEELLEDMDTIMAQSQLYTLEEWNQRPWYRRVFASILKLGAIWL